MKAAALQGAGNEILVEALVRNDGAETDEVAQVYAQNEGSENAPRNPRLCAFQRVHLAAGEEKTVLLRVRPEQLQVVNEAGEWVREGKPVFYVGLSQPDPRSQALTGRACVKIAL